MSVWQYRLALIHVVVIIYNSIIQTEKKDCMTKMEKPLTVNPMEYIHGLHIDISHCVNLIEEVLDY